jgi:hypothetical protein
MKSKNKNTGIIIVTSIIVILFLYKSSSLNRTGNVATRDISLGDLCCSYTSLPSQTKADNFFMFNNDPIASQLAPDSLDIYYDYFSIIHDTSTGYSTMPTDWFLYPSGADPNNPDNRLRTTGYDEYQLNISNPAVMEWEYNRLLAVLVAHPEVDGLHIDLAYPSLYPSFYTITRAEPAVTYDGLTVNVSKQLYNMGSVGWKLDAVKMVSTNPQGTGQNKYGGSHTDYSINLISNPNVLYTTNPGLELSTAVNVSQYYPSGLQPTGYSITKSSGSTVFSTSATQVTDSHGGTYAWLITVNSSDTSWARRLSVTTYTVGVGATVNGTVWVKPLGNISMICAVLEGRKSGIAYGGPSSCIDTTVLNTWAMINISRTLPIDTSCGGVACDQIMFYVYANTMSNNIGSFIVDDFSLSLLNPLVAPGTTLYVTYGSKVSTPSSDLVAHYHDYMKAGLAGLKQRVPSGKLVIFNQIEGLPNLDYLDVVDGAQDEGYIRAYWTSPNSESNVGMTGSSWDNEMSVSQTIIKEGKYLNLDCGVYSGSTPEYRQRVFDYCFPSFLLLQNKGQVSFSFQDYGNSTGWYFSEFDYQYGIPIDDYYKLSTNPNIYARDYTSSIVIVNPNMQNANIILPVTYKTRDGTEINSLTLNNRTGIVLYKANSNKTVQIVYGTDSTIVNYVNLLNISLILTNTGRVDYDNVRIVSSNPPALYRPNNCSAPLSLKIGETKQISCLIGSTELTSIGYGSKPWSLTIVGKNTYTGKDDIPISSVPLSVELKPDLIGSFTMDMSVKKDG